MPQPPEQEAEVVSDGSEHGVDGIAARMGEIIAAHAVILLEVPDDGLNGRAPSHVTFDLRGDAALPGNPYDGHTLATVIPAMQAILGNTLDRVIADAGYRGHNASPEYQFKIYTAGQKRRITPQIKRDMRRRAAVEPVIGHLKEDHRMDRNYLAHSSGDAINAVLAAVRYNFRLLLRWLRLLLFRILIAIVGTSQLRFS